MQDFFQLDAPYGNPSKREELGNTEITQEIFIRY